MDYSEKQMANVFMDLLQSSEGLSGIGAFDSIFPEVTCLQGRPDFIAIRNKNNLYIKPLPKPTGLVGSSILSLLKNRAPRKLEYIEAKSGFTKDSVRRSLKQLLLTGHIEKNGHDSYILGKVCGQFGIEIWTFELKLNNTKRAIFQAQQNLAFAECSIIVVPPGKDKNYNRFSQTMKRWGIGLAVFNPITNDFLVIQQPRKSRTRSRQHKVYAIAQFLKEEK